MDNKHVIPSGVGLISLLMSLIVICLVVFSVLSFSGALGNYHYAEHLAESNKAYYQAVSNAQETRELLDRVARSSRGISVIELAAAVENAEITTLPNGEEGIMTEEAISEKEKLVVKFALQDGAVTVFSRTKLSGDWTSAPGLNLRK